MQTLHRQLPLALASACGLALCAAPAARAADGLIDITGVITANTCSINVNGGGTADGTVTLPPTSVTALATVGQRAGATPFTITLSGCSPPGGIVHAHFEGQNIDLASGSLRNLAVGGATNTNFQLSNANGTPLDLAAANQGSSTFTIDMGSATLRYLAWYLAVGGGATAGLVSSSVEYSLIYQ